MVLTTKQEEGLRTAVCRFKQGEKYTCISGYAGTGKSTLVRFIIDALNIPNNRVAYCAYTGKAAHVLAQKGCPNAITAHKLLYKPFLGLDGQYHFLPKEPKTDFDIIVVDEVSMLPKDMWDLLCKWPSYILACGDPAQLPPVFAENDESILDKPHVFLDQVMRQAQESEIIRLSMYVREGHMLSEYKGLNQEVKSISQNEISRSVLLWADQIITATNDARQQINNTVRTIKGYPNYPIDGDKVVGLTNHWNSTSDAHCPFTNGTIGYLSNLQKDSFYLPYYIRNTNRKIDIYRANIKTELDGTFHDLILDYNFLLEGKHSLTTAESYQLSRAKKPWYKMVPFDIDYAYALTCHKMQGSEANKILVFEEKFPYSKEEHIRWAYTACTRASEKLVIVKN